MANPQCYITPSGMSVCVNGKNKIRFSQICAPVLFVRYRPPARLP